MKKTILFLMLSLLSYAGYSQIVTIPDINFKNCLLADTTINTNGDGEIQLSEAITFTGEVRCTALSISDLTGIEAFVNITRLAVYDNQLTSVDISQNTELTTFLCSNNQLTNIDVSQNTQLYSLWCRGNQLTSIDVSQNTMLNNLLCDGNALTSLDLSQNIMLENVWCHQNQLTNLNITQNVNLISLNTSNNLLTSLDTSQNGVLTFLSCDNNNLTQLDVSQNSQLELLWCYVNDLSSLDVTNNSALKDLKCYANMISELDLSSNGALELLSCQSNLLTKIDVSNNLALTELNCGSNELVNLSVCKNTALTKLYCANTQISSLDASNNTQLIDLRCNVNPLLSRVSLANGNNTNVTNLNLGFTPNLTCVEVDNAFYSAINWTNNQPDFVLEPQHFFSQNCNNNIGLTFVPDDVFEQKLIDLGYDSGPLDDFVPTCNINTVTQLIVAGSIINSITDLTGIEDFVALEFLSCGKNDLTSLDVSKNLELEELYISDNNLTSLDLSNNLKLKHLECFENELTQLNLDANVLLETLFCRDNLFAELDLSQNPALTKLSCSSNPVLNSLNIANGNNTNIEVLITANDPNLSCIQVDDSSFATANWIDDNLNFSFDATHFFSEDCGMTLIPDLNFEQALIDLGFDTAPANGMVLTATISAIPILDVRNRSISDLTGIAEFTSLKSLFVQDNQLNNLDVSQNTQLRRLNCRDNNLSNLDVSGNTDLRKLNCKNNQITSLDFSQNLKFKSLNGNNNQLESLNVKNGNNTNFTKFKAKNNPNLLCIEVDDVPYSTQNWTIIDAQTFFSEDCGSNRTFAAENKQFQAGQTSEGLKTASPEIQIYPNPTNEIIHIKSLEDSFNSIITISDIQGRLVYISTINTPTSTHNIGNLNGGVYFVRLESDRGVFHTSKLIKK